jgi:large conductance mechanosensitive channel
VISEFRQFLHHYGIIGLAIAVIIGGKLNALVTSVVNDLVMPLLLQPALNAAGVARIGKLHYNGIFYGKVLGAGIEFLLVAFIIFIFAKKVLKEENVSKK